MRLTQCLRKQHIGWWFKRKWKEQGHRPIIEIRTPEKLARERTEIVDAAEHFKIKDPLVKFTVPEPWNQAEKIPKEMNPDWHDKPCLFFTSETNLLEGEVHVQNLTKTLCNRGLPQTLQQIYDKLNIEEWDELLQSFTLNSLLRDSYQSLLPKIVDKERLWYHFQREYGIPIDRKVSLIFNSYMRLADMIVAAKNPAAVLKRDLLPNIHASAPVDKDGDLIQYRVNASLALTSSELLKPFADESEVIATLEQPLPDMYPLNPILDLKSENIYKSYNFLGIPPNQSTSSIHTLFLANLFTDDWSPSQVVATALGTCHGFALAQAKHLFGNDAPKLPHPISLQCVQTDSKTFNFILYQLNTLDNNGVDGLKNLAWIDSHDLYTRCERVSFRDTMENFNNDVFRRFLAFYCNGLTM